MSCSKRPQKLWGAIGRSRFAYTPFICPSTAARPIFTVSSRTSHWRASAMAMTSRGSGSASYIIEERKDCAPELARPSRSMTRVTSPSALRVVVQDGRSHLAIELALDLERAGAGGVRQWPFAVQESCRDRRHEVERPSEGRSLRHRPGGSQAEAGRASSRSARREDLARRGARQLVQEAHLARRLVDRHLLARPVRRSAARWRPRAPRDGAPRTPPRPRRDSRRARPRRPPPGSPGAGRAPPPPRPGTR